jgi:hypothetical protein
MTTKRTPPDYAEALAQQGWAMMTQQAQSSVVVISELDTP